MAVASRGPGALLTRRPRAAITSSDPRVDGVSCRASYRQACVVGKALAIPKSRGSPSWVLLELSASSK